MRFCQTHWDSLRLAIENRGMEHLIARGESEVGRRAVGHMRGDNTLETFEPLLAAHFQIINNLTILLQEGGVNVMYLFEDGPEDEIELPGGEGRTWPRCPLCYVNIAHELSCGGEGCKLDPVHGYDYMIDRAADEQRENWQKLKARGCD